MLTKFSGSFFDIGVSHRLCGNGRNFSLREYLACEERLARGARIHDFDWVGYNESFNDRIRFHDRHFRGSIGPAACHKSHAAQRAQKHRAVSATPKLNS